MDKAFGKMKSVPITSKEAAYDGQEKALYYNYGNGIIFLYN